MQVLEMLDKLVKLVNVPKGWRTLEEMQDFISIACDFYGTDIPDVDTELISAYLHTLQQAFNCEKIKVVEIYSGKKTGLAVIKPRIRNIDGELILCIGDKQFPIALDWVKGKTRINSFETHIMPGSSPSMIFKALIDCPDFSEYIESPAHLDYPPFATEFEKTNKVKPTDKQVETEAKRVFALLQKSDSAAIEFVAKQTNPARWINKNEDFETSFFCGTYRLVGVIDTVKTRKDGGTFSAPVAQILVGGEVCNLEPPLISPLNKALKSLQQLENALPLYLEKQEITLQVTDFYVSELGYSEFKGNLQFPTIRRAVLAPVTEPKQIEKSAEVPDSAVLTNSQATSLWNLAKKNGWTKEDCQKFLQQFGIDSFREIPLTKHEELKAAFSSTEELNKLHTTSESAEMPWNAPVAAG